MEVFKRSFARYWVSVVLGVFTFTLYALLVSTSIVGGDAGDLASSAYVLGVPHPSGYPLYTFLGFLTSHLVPYSTVAWRIGILSAVFSALSVALFYSISYFLTKNKGVSFIVSLALAFVYPFWLYSVTVEVFSLAVFFLLCILSISLSLRQRFSTTKFFFLLFFLGLSATHHHTILFLIPSVFILLRPQFSHLRKNVHRRFVFTSFGAFFLGLLPLLYLPIASFFNPPIDWERPSTLSGFINLLFRVSYGTFQAGPSIVDNPIPRLVSLVSFFQLAFFDLGVVCLIFSLVGIVVSRKERYFAGLIAGLFFYVFFFFYASFPVVNAFSLATFERFSLFPYVFILLFASYGFAFLQKRLKKQWIVILIFLYPISLFISNISAIHAIGDSRPSEILGHHMLQSARDDSLILLVNDTPLFATQYVYFTEDTPTYRSRIPIHFHKLYFPYYFETLKRNYPSISFPSVNGAQDDLRYLSDFMDINAGKSNIYTNFYLSDLAVNFVPSGLLFRYIPSFEDYPSLESVIEENTTFWNRVNDLNPTETYYENNFTAEILNVYSNGLQNYAHYLLDKSAWKEAQLILQKAKKLTPTDPDLAFLEGLSYELQGQCRKAEERYLAVSHVHSRISLIWGQLAKLSRECFKDEQKALKYDSKRRSLGDTSIPLNEL